MGAESLIVHFRGGGGESERYGDLNFQGRLPFTVATTPADYPFFGNTEDEVNVDYTHGYERFETSELSPRYWFGYGLSSTLVNPE